VTRNRRSGLVVLLLAVAGGVAAAALLNGGNGTTNGIFSPPRGSLASPTRGGGTVRVAARARVRFSVTGAGRGVLYPGGPSVPVELVFTNPNRKPITIISAQTTVAGTSTAGCSGDEFVVARQLHAQPHVPGKATSSLTALGISVDRWPALRMVDSGNQDACRAASVELKFSATARR
jgi:hypothetical protein